MDLSTRYMGLALKNPLVASASPLSDRLEKIKRLEDAGISAVVMFSLFEEQLRQEARAFEHFLSYGTESFGEALSYFPEVDDFQVGPDQYLELVAAASKACDIPIIGSLNGIGTSGWTSYAKKIEDAGAAGLELNVYLLPTEIDKTSAQVEQTYLDILAAVKKTVSIPVAMKLGPYFSSVANMAKRLDDAGADALVLFNRFYQPDLDIEELEVVRSLELSTPSEMRLPLLWIAVLHGKLKASIGASTGLYSAKELAKYVAAGADVGMVTSALLKNGPGHAAKILADFETWLTEKEYDSLDQLRGSLSQQSVADPTAFERANYIKILEHYKSEFGAV